MFVPVLVSDRTQLHPAALSRMTWDAIQVCAPASRLGRHPHTHGVTIRCAFVSMGVALAHSDHSMCDGWLVPDEVHVVGIMHDLSRETPWPEIKTARNVLMCTWNGMCMYGCEVIVDDPKNRACAQVSNCSRSRRHNRLVGMDAQT